MHSTRPGVSPPRWGVGSCRTEPSGCRLGPWELETQRRRLGTLEPPYSETLPEVPAEELLVNLLRVPVVCLAGAANAECVAGEVAPLSEP